MTWSNLHADSHFMRYVAMLVLYIVCIDKKMKKYFNGLCGTSSQLDHLYKCCIRVQVWMQMQTCTFIIIVEFVPRITSRCSYSCNCYIEVANGYFVCRLRHRCDWWNPTKDHRIVKLWSLWYYVPVWETVMWGRIEFLKIIRDEWDLDNAEIEYLMCCL